MKSHGPLHAPFWEIYGQLQAGGHLEDYKKVGLRLVAALMRLMVHQLTFQRAEKALHGCIVIPASDAIHTGLDAMVPQQGLIGAIRVLAALVGVVDETCFGLASPDSHLQGTNRQRSRHSPQHGPADDLVGVQVQDSRQVEPPLIARSCLPWSDVTSGALSKRCACSLVSQRPIRCPSARTPFTALIPLAAASDRASSSASSRPSLRITESL